MTPLQHLEKTLENKRAYRAEYIRSVDEGIRALEEQIEEARQPHWVSQDGRITKMSDMQSDHLMNAILKLGREAPDAFNGKLKQLAEEATARRKAGTLIFRKPQDRDQYGVRPEYGSPGVQIFVVVDMDNDYNAVASAPDEATAKLIAKAMNRDPRT